MRRCPPAPSASSTSPAHPSSQCWPQKSYLGAPRDPLAQRPLRSCKGGCSRRPTHTYPHSCRPFLCSRLIFVPPQQRRTIFCSISPPAFPLFLLPLLALLFLYSLFLSFLCPPRISPLPHSRLSCSCLCSLAISLFLLSITIWLAFSSIASLTSSQLTSSFFVHPPSPLNPYHLPHLSQRLGQPAILLPTLP